MQIILIRHGQAERQLTTDAERALTAHGEWQAQQTAAWLTNNDYQLDGLFASPYLRAQQTAHYLAEALDVHVTLSDAIKPDSHPLATIQWLEQLELPEASTIALVCHMPIVGRLASFLLDGNADMGMGFNLAEAKVINLPVFAAGLGEQIDDYVPLD